MERQILPPPPMDLLRRRHLRAVFSFGFLWVICFASLNYFHSNLLETTVGRNWVTIVYSAASLLTIGAYLNFSKIINFYGSLKTILCSLAIMISSLTLISLNITNPLIVIVGLIIYLITTSLIGLSIDVYIEAESDDSKTGEIRGLFLSTINTAAFIAPAMGGFIASKYGLGTTYLVAALTLIPAGIIIYFAFRKFSDRIYSGINSFSDLKIQFLNSTHRSSFMIQLILQSFFALMVIYTPLYLREIIGLSLQQIGIIMSIILVAYVITEWPVGKILNQLNIKRFYLAGVAMLVASLILLSIIPANTAIIGWVVILFMSRIGAAILEVMSETLFFKNIQATDTNAMEVYRLISPISYLIVPMIAGLILITTSYQVLFIVFAIMIVIGGVSTHKTL